MKREWQPGDVALVTEYDEPMVALVGHRKGTKIPMFLYADGGFDVAGPMGIGEGEVLDIAARPLVVIDPENREAVERLVRLFWDANTDDGDEDGNYMQSALREFADPKPAKPEEPQGLGAVVEDEDGVLWVRDASADAVVQRRYWSPANDDRREAWDNVAVVRVLSEGVEVAR